VAGTIDDEVKLLMDKAYDHCAQILKKDEQKLMQVVEFLMANEIMSGKQFEACMRGEVIEEEIGHTPLMEGFSKPETEE
jgi:cell division protease FtsH